MWIAAERVSRDALIAAIFITAIKSTDWYDDFTPLRGAREALDIARDQAFLRLKRHDVDTYSTARSWFLPERFELKGSPQTGEELVAQLAVLIGDFLVRWIPVQVSVRFGR